MLLAAQQAEAQITFSGGVSIQAGAGFHSSFSKFRKEYNRVNEAGISKKLKSLSTLFGYGANMQCLINKLYTSADFDYQFSSAKVSFNNDARRYWRLRQRNIISYIGWNSATENSLCIAIGLGANFSKLNSHVRLGDGTEYYAAGGFSGEYKDVAFCIGLKARKEYAFSDRLSVFAQARFRFLLAYLEDGFTETFVRGNSGINLNGYTIANDCHSLDLSVGVQFNIVKKDL